MDSYASKNGVSVRVYQGDAMSLLAFDLHKALACIRGSGLSGLSMVRKTSRVFILRSSVSEIASCFYFSSAFFDFLVYICYV
jgi:hypothetical protein